MGVVSSKDTDRLAVYKGNPGRGGSRPRPTKAAQEAGNVEPCKWCGEKHPSEECKFKNATCYGCRKTGHLRSVCRSVNRKFNLQSKVHNIQSDSQGMHGHMPESEVSVEAADLSEAAFGLYNVDSRPIGRLTSVPYKVQVKIKGKTLVMELDTGASRSTVSENIYKKLLSSYPLYDCKIQLHSYAGMRVPVLGCVTVPVSYENNPEQWLKLVVVKGVTGVFFCQAHRDTLYLFLFYVCSGISGNVSRAFSYLSFSFSLSGLFYSGFLYAGASKTQSLRFQQVFITKIKKGM